jgi:hypothetical protein
MLKGMFGDPFVRIIRLQRRGKKQSVEPVKRFPTSSTTEKQDWYGTSRAGIYESTWKWKSAVWIAKPVAW